MGERIIKGVFVRVRSDATTLDGRTVTVARSTHRGDVVNLSDAEEARLDALGVLLPKGTQAITDPAALERSLITLQPSAAPPGLGAAPTGVDLIGDTGAPDTPPVPDADDEDLPLVTSGPFDARGATLDEAQEWLAEQKPTAPQVVEAAYGDPNAAALLLEAENLQTGRDPRVTVTGPLQAIIDAPPAEPAAPVEPPAEPPADAQPPAQ